MPVLFRKSDECLYFFQKAVVIFVGETFRSVLLCQLNTIYMSVERLFPTSATSPCFGNQSFCPFWPIKRETIAIEVERQAIASWKLTPWQTNFIQVWITTLLVLIESSNHVTFS